MDDTLYDNAAYYRLMFDTREHDVSFYRDAAAEDAAGELLELGVGTGRVALPLARAGHRLTGVDSSAAMLASLAEQVAAEPAEVRDRLCWHHGDAGTIDLGLQFPLVICPFNCIAHQHELAELAAFLGNVRAHLRPGGRFAFDTLIPDPTLLRGESSTIPWFRDPRTEEVSRCDEDIAYDPLSQVLTIRTTIRSMEAERAPQVLTLRLRQLFPQETRLLLEHHGFEILRQEDLGDAIGYVCRCNSG